MRILITGILLILNLVLQSTLFHSIEIRGIMPNTAIIIIVSFALLRGSFTGAAIGFFSGLLQDMFFGTTLGYYALWNMLIGYVCGKAHQEFYSENYILPLVFCTAATFLYGLIIYCTGFLFRGNLNFLYYLFNLILPETVYTAVCSLFLYRLLFSFNDFIENRERYHRRLF